MITKNILKNMGLKTDRQFKALKRQKLKAVIKALDEYGLGSAACPSDVYANFKEVRRLVNEMKKSQRADTWGR